ncbi:GspE/PulE family protein [Stratiformator vulcanicus]|uniref:Type II secretion system protein E n=1 Tax=Stratiformator vulcanicus TaxID=2527980 RepID=A0A517QYI6_9PLAN|nr:GspE/PulE family protein [Stratiformator vulcanicus]QDT36705.1 Type II secretion system protein E [Stratiformator vulcanicus]
MSLLSAKPRLGDQLIDRGFLTQEELEAALSEQSASNGSKLLGEVLVQQEYISEEQLLEVLSEDIGVPFVRLDNRMFDPKIFGLIPREFVEKHTVLPLFKVRDTLTVAVPEPSDVFLIDQIKSTARCEVQVVAATAKEIRRMVQTYMPNTQVFVIDDIIDDARGDAVELIQEQIDDIAADADIAGQSPIIRLVNYIVYNAVRQGASDIHIEPNDRQLRVRYRVDGALHQALEPPVHLAPAVASRIKIMAGLDISERRLPQDGRVHVMMDGRTLDLRVSILPMPAGEKVVIRILDNSSIRVALAELGFSSEVLESLEQQITRPNGIALVTGPTGSGKSTTLYAVLNEIASPEQNVCTVEDPVEYRLDTVNQFQANERIGLTFPTILRSLLRQDPDILMVGEIRDEETARVAVQAAMTGHLVLSTLHTNDAVGTVSRLIDMGIEGYLVAASLNMVLAQRLCRRVCPKCRMEYKPEKHMRNAVDAMGFEIEKFYKGRGCKKCRQTGYSGRIAIHELLVVDEGLADLISDNPSIHTLREYVRDSGMVPLRYDGFRKVREGITTVEQILKVTSEGWTPRKPSIANPAGE